MGWTCMYQKPHDIIGYFKNNRPNVKCCGMAFVGRFVLYGVWEDISKEGVPYRYATIHLLSYSGYGYAFSHKDMDESCGPSERRMPMTLLKELFKAKSPRAAYGSVDLYGKEWRRACIRYHMSKGRYKKKGGSQCHGL